MTFFKAMLLIFLIACAVSVFFTKKLITSVVVFMGYSVIMAIIWLLLEAPDLALTEAAVGAGITSVLYFQVIRRINEMEETRNGK